MIGRFYDWRCGAEIELQHSSNAEERTFWLRIKSVEKNATAQLGVVEAKVLIALLSKAIKEAEEE